MNKKNLISILFAFLSLAVATPLYAAGNPYASDGVTDYQYYQGFYNYKRLTNLQECLKASGGFDKNGYRVANYDEISKSCDIKSYSIMPLETATAPSVPQPEAKEAWNSAAKNYHDRFVQKCLSTYNDPNVKACCEMQATADTDSMQKRGVFDTPTTAEIPIRVDENKCKPKEYKHSCSDFIKSVDAQSGKQGACEDYLNKCLDMGKWLDGKEETRQKLCETDYSLQRPLELSTREKFMNICAKLDKSSDDPVDKAIGCGADYYSYAKEYRDRCVASLNKANYNPFSNWFIKFRAFLFKSSKAKYEEQSKECLKRLDAALDKKMIE